MSSELTLDTNTVKPLAVVGPSTRALVESADELAASVPSSLCIETRDHFTSAASSLRQVKAAQKKLEEERVSATGPINQALRTINDWFRDPAQRLVRAEGILKRAMAVFETQEQERLRIEAAMAARKQREEQEELERRAAKAQERGQTEKASTLHLRAKEVAAAPPAPTSMAPKASQVSFQDQWKFEIIDLALIPREYLAVDMAKIGAYVRAMKADAKIAGVRVYSERQVRSGAAR